MRAQIHLKEDGTYRVFSRHLEDVTGRYPDVIEAMGQAAQPGTTSFIVDAEVVAWDPANDVVLPFQTVGCERSSSSRIKCF